MESKTLGGILIGVFVMLVSLMSATSVDTGHVGVVTRYGEVLPDVLQPGFSMRNPMDIVHEMDTRVLVREFQSVTYTKDLQQAVFKSRINFSLDPAQARTIFMTVGVDWQEKLLDQEVHRSLKDIVGKWNAESLVSEREKIGNAYSDALMAVLANKHILLSGAAITNIDFNDAYENAIEAKVVATQNALAEVNRTRQKEELARQTVVAAEADAEAMRIRARALEVNPKLVEWERVQMQRDVGMALAAKGLPANLTVISGDSLPAMMLGMPTTAK